MSLDIAAVIIVLAAAILPIALIPVTKPRRKRRYPGTVKLAPGIRIHADDMPRHLSAGRNRTSGTGTWWLPALGNFAAEKAPARSS